MVALVVVVPKIDGALTVTLTLDDSDDSCADLLSGDPAALIAFMDLIRDAIIDVKNIPAKIHLTSITIYVYIYIYIYIYIYPTLSPSIQLDITRSSHPTLPRVSASRASRASGVQTPLPRNPHPSVGWHAVAKWSLY